MEKERATVFTIILFLSFFMVNSITNNNNNNNFIIFAQGENTSKQMMPMEQTTGFWENDIPPITNWIGVFSLGMMSALLAFKTTDSNDFITKRQRIIISVAIISIAVGLIHLLLIHEHIQVSIWWGLFFLISGIAQVIYGIMIGFVKKPHISMVLYYIGIIGNIVLFIILILARVVTPPFSDTGTPENWDPTSIITLIIEAVIPLLLIYVLRHKEMRTIIK
jgi:hypothetical protein